MTVESLQELINNKADQKWSNDIYKACQAMEGALNKGGVLHDQIDFGLKHGDKISPQWIIRKMRELVNPAGRDAYRQEEARELLSKLEAVQGQIEELQQNQPQ